MSYLDRSFCSEGSYKSKKCLTCYRFLTFEHKKRAIKAKEDILYSNFRKSEECKYYQKIKE
jgi:hypothetical protein